MLQKLKDYYNNQTVNWTARFIFYLAILLLLFFMYGFNDANAGNYIYNEF
jgi:hypothetical protein